MQICENKKLFSSVIKRFSFKVAIHSFVLLYGRKSLILGGRLINWAINCFCLLTDRKVCLYLSEQVSEMLKKAFLCSQKLSNSFAVLNTNLTLKYKN